jgi:polyhydroxyalkanoate depolymerase
MSGHFATLLRPTVQQMVVDHDVYLTDWHNARDVPLHLGEFGLDAFVGLLVDVVAELGPDVHVMAVCQPCVPALAAVAVLAERGIEPRSLTLVAGPIDGRVAPTTVNALATSHPLEWFEQRLISVVPMRFAGRGRRVYPGFLQLGGFLAMNPHRHLRSQLDRFGHLTAGDDERAAAIGRFYEEYLAVMDLPGAFYLETVQRVFQEFELARGEMTFQGKVVDPGVIRRTPLLTVEAERDDMCAPGQTAAAHDLCSGLPDHFHDHHLQAGVGHYGVFSGRRWEREIYPRVSRFIADADAPSGRSA